MLDTNFATPGKRQTQEDVALWTLEEGGERYRNSLQEKPYSVLMPSHHIGDNIKLKKQILRNPNKFLYVERDKRTAQFIEQEHRNLGYELSCPIWKGDVFDFLFEGLLTLRGFGFDFLSQIGHIDADPIQCFDMKCLKFIEDSMKYEVSSVHLTIDTHRGKDDFQKHMHEKYRYPLNNKDQEGRIGKILTDTIRSPYKFEIFKYEGIKNKEGKHGSHMIVVCLVRVKN